jgi:hypothetical protein
MRTVVVVLALLSLVAFAGPAGGGSVPPFPALPGTWSHAEINVSINKKPHTLILDRGRITKISGAQVTLHRRDRTNVVIQLSPSAVVVIDRVPATIYALKKRMDTQTMRIDGGPAVRIRATS